MEKALIISTNALGDTYLSASALEPLRKSKRFSEIHFIAPANSDFFLQSLPIDKIFYLAEKKIINILKLLNTIRQTQYSFVFTFFPGIVNTIFFYCSKSKVKAGFPNFIKMNKWYNISQSLKVKGNPPDKFTWHPKMNYLLRVSKPLEFAGIKANSISKPIFNSIKIDNVNPVSGISIHFKAKDKERSISIENIIELCNNLFRKGIKEVSLVGVNADFNEKLFAFCKKFNIHIIKEPSLRNLLDLILNSRVFVGVDSFPLHIADAYNSRFLGVFGPTEPSAVLNNPHKSIRFNFSVYTDIDHNLLIKEIEKIYNYV